MFVRAQNQHIMPLVVTDKSTEWVSVDSKLQKHLFNVFSMFVLREVESWGKRKSLVEEEGKGKIRRRKMKPFCSFQKLVLRCAVGPSRTPTWDWGHLSAEIGASIWHFIGKYTLSYSELTRALEGTWWRANTQAGSLTQGRGKLKAN